MYNSNNELPIKASRILGHKKYSGEYKPKTDIGCLLIENEKIIDTDISRSTFDGSFLRNSFIKNVNMSRCDFEGTRVETTSFENVNFQHADIKSSIFVGCEFHNCIFKDAYISDVLFSECKLDTCDFSDTVFIDSKILNSIVRKGTFSRSSNTLNEFRSVVFDQITLGDCSFGLHIIKECTFKDVKINIDALGYIYGITPSDVDSLTFIHKGSDIDVSEHNNLLVALEQEYKNRELFFPQAITRLNFQTTTTMYALLSLMESLIENIESGRIVKKEEIKFLEKVIIELNQSEKLPAFSLFRLVDELTKLKTVILPTEEDPSKLGLLQLANRMTFMVHKCLDTLRQILDLLPDENKENIVKLRISFDKAPDKDLIYFLKKLTQHSGLRDIRGPRVLSIEKGSIVYLLEISLECVILLSLFLYLVEGSIIQITKIKARINVLFKKKLPKAFIEESLVPRQSLPVHLLPIINGIMKFISSDLSSYKDNLNGFEKSNLLEMEIEEFSAEE